MARALIFLAGALCLLLPGTSASARRPNANGLVQVVAPATRGEARAHPHVNVIVRFGATEDGVPADPATFRARLGGADITAEFGDIVEAGGIVGKRAQIVKDRLRVGRGRTNRMRFSASALAAPGRASGRGRALRDVDRIRFLVTEGANTTPVAKLADGPRSFRPGVPFTVDGSQSFDPDGDPITIAWDFGDGTVLDGPTATHVYQEFADRIVRLIVRDGGANPDGSPSESVVAEAFLAEPVLPEGVDPGSVFVDSQTGLEFGVVTPGTTAQRTLTIRNLDEREGRRVIARIFSDVPAFVFDPDLVDLGPGAEATVTVSFAPATVGHQHAIVSLVFAAENRQSLRVLARGYGGAGAGTGPTLAATPVFYSEGLPNVFGLALHGIRPDGSRFTVDSSVHTCQATGGGFSSGDVCLTDADCAANGGICQQSGTCFGGPRNREPCASVGDCPSGSCSSAQLFDTVDLCGDGVGGLFLLSDEGTFSDPAVDNELSATLLRIDVDAAGATTGKQILDRVVSDTTKLACDGFRPEENGRVYVAEFRTDPNAPFSCVRSDKELLVGVNKRTGGTQTVMSRIDAATGLRDCEDDFDPVTHLEASREVRPNVARPIFAGFESRGVWRILPAPLQFVLPETYVGGIRPAVFPHESFRLHPDGSLVLIATGGGRAGGLVNVYRLTESQVLGNPLPVSALTPCASVQLPTNLLPEQTQGFTSVLDFAVAPAAAGGRDATLLVGAATGSPRLGEVLGRKLQVRVTVAFSLPADSPECSLAGLVALEAQEQLTF